MKLGKVIGRVVCSVKVDSLEGEKLLLMQPIDENQVPYGTPIVACDTVQAGTGDIVFYESSKEAAKALKNGFNPSDAAIIGIVDQINHERKL
jgi:ethanolamine utilization protein EutN